MPVLVGGVHVLARDRVHGHRAMGWRLAFCIGQRVAVRVKPFHLALDWRVFRGDVAIVWCLRCIVDRCHRHNDSDRRGRPVWVFDLHREGVWPVVARVGRVEIASIRIEGDFPKLRISACPVSGYASRRILVLELSPDGLVLRGLNCR